MNPDNLENLTPNDLIGIYADYIDALRCIYQLTPDNVENTFIKVKDILLNKYKFDIDNIFPIVVRALYLRDSYMKSYLQLYDLINSLDNYEHLRRNVYRFKDIITAIENNEIITNDQYFELYKPNSIFNAIMNDDVTTLAYITNQPDFNINITIEKDFFGKNSNINLLEACSYYGSEKCYLYLRENNNFEPSNLSIALSFLGGNPRIINESLPLIEEDNLDKCAEYVIASHNIDFLIYLINNFELSKMVLDHMIRHMCHYCNLEALLIFLNFGLINEFVYLIYRFSNDDLALYFFKKFKESAIKRFPIFSAMQDRLSKTVKYAIECGFNIEETNDIQKGILHYAAEYDLKEIVELAMSRKLDINKKDDNGYTPLHYGVRTGKDMVGLLISYGADVNAKTNRNQTPLILAHGNKDIVEILVSHGAVVNKK
ncbi:hypothetical protein TVAG_233450 [Trichomonas vaginalis G3]|uniref:DUF3447 domain-containing protein n=1 Tax=Trichomonas vaginalis (strain ATCC PRA-98 / G3) TaxID=412133 RepID=A2FPH9_TRIV3|nr:proteasome regulatory particle assembly [Trichomonas vaginalis G3]EAX93180.1 hypothetical protein TVAG_233450 [Trichomonas vaginalis G3]KAI5522061.1 proteasome regulatory particle assembly [Trichomonas vaginalis G3]|eukprot:XP_001306110.1 hypothetical protein [Trichomonas vaginalis G3]